MSIVIQQNTVVMCCIGHKFIPFKGSQRQPKGAASYTFGCSTCHTTPHGPCQCMQAELCSQQQSLQPQEDNNAAAKQRQQIDAFETEQFVNWANHNNHNCSDKGDHVSTSTGKRALSSEINTCHVMDLEQSTNLKELRYAATSQAVGHCIGL